ncbi:MAG: hypothetical protein R2729_07660 [Bryobacteraceae bacterium]
MTRRQLLPLAAAAIPGVCRPQSSNPAVDYKTDRPHPRLLLPARRLKLVQRERERESLRWIAFQTLIKAKANFPEPGFVDSLYFVTTGDQAYGRRAIEWALKGSDVRQQAFVFDWCQELLSAAEKKALGSRMTAGMAALAKDDSIAAASARILAASALTGHEPGMAEQHIAPVVDIWWKRKILTPIAKGEVPIEQKEHLALLEMFHVLRDNLDIDLREAAAKFFTTLPIYHILAHYPAPFPAPENEYRIPLMAAHQEPDLREATRSRAAGLAMVAYDNNSQEMQFLQGWLINDRFLLRGPYGIPYEYLWANPYQPGLSFHYLPNIYHDPRTGRLIIRSTWEDDAVWYYQAGGARQMFEQGQIRNLDANALDKQIVMGNTILLPASMSPRFTIATEDKTTYYVVGLDPESIYGVEVDDEEIRDVRSDRGGVLELNFPPKRYATVLLNKIAKS